MKQTGSAPAGARGFLGHRWDADTWSLSWSEMLAGVPVLENTGGITRVSGVQYDSRRVRPGDVFVAMRGATADGNLFVSAAIASGASGVVTDSRDTYEALRVRRRGVPVALVEQGRRALAAVAAQVFRHPEQTLAVSGVTGTNGKTTTAFLLEQMLRSAGRTCVLLGTIETHVADEVRVSEHTTPEARDVLATFADGVLAGASEAVMEMSSHALEQERVWGIPVDVAIFTNFTQDHLDYHGTMERYFEAKMRLFSGVGTRAPRVAVVNVDDSRGAEVAARAKAAGSEVITYGLGGGEYRAQEIELRTGKTTFRMTTPSGEVAVRSGLTGRVNVYNLLAALCAGLARGMSLQEAAGAAEGLGYVPGRFQVVPSGGLGITVVVDYAHTDDALKNLIALGRELAGAGRVITLFGCGGDRDRGKRPKMGRVAGEGSDLVVVTSDNPRSESPAAIVEDVLVGLRKTGATAIVELDRAGAIRIAIRGARRGDVVLIAGKGHEKTQTFEDETVPFDDVAEAEDVLRELSEAGLLPRMTNPR